MFGTTADQVKAGKLFGTFVQYGYDTAPVTGATLEYEPGKAFNPIVPAAVVKELDDMAAEFKTGSAEDRADGERRAQRRVTPDRRALRAADRARAAMAVRTMAALLEMRGDRSQLRRRAGERRRRSRSRTPGRSSAFWARTARARAR